MSLSLRFADFEKGLRDLKKTPQFLRIEPEDRERLPFTDMEIIEALLVTKYEGDTIQTVPSCDCGLVKGRPNHNVVCRACNYRALSPVERGFESDVWVKAPKCIVGFINPTYFRMITRALQSVRTNPINLMEYCCNDLYRVEPTALKYAAEMDQILRALNIRRGYNNFIENFIDILTMLEKTAFVKEKTKIREIRLLKLLYNKYGDILFPNVMPLPPKRSIITEITGKVRNTRNDAPLLIDAAHIMYKAVNYDNTQQVIERGIYKSLSKFADYYSALEANTLSKKEGWFRKHIFGSRIGPSFRAVITSLAGAHRHYELHLPYGLAIATYRPQIMSRLLRQDTTITINDAERYLINAINSKVDQSDSPIMAIFNDLLAEVPDGHPGFPVLFGRNPTLNLRSIQLLYVTKIKSDPLDNTISFSLLALRGPNADFDGDEMTGIPILCWKDWEDANKLSPHSGIDSLESPYSLNRNLELPDTDFSTLNNFMYGN